MLLFSILHRVCNTHTPSLHRFSMHCVYRNKSSILSTALPKQYEVDLIFIRNIPSLGEEVYTPME